LGYDTSTIAPAGPSLNAAVTIELFEDKRRAHQSALIFSAESNPVTTDGKEVCLNLEQEYAGTIMSDLRNVMERHFRQRGVISLGTMGKNSYVLQGSLISLYGRQDYPQFVPFIGWAPGLGTAIPAVASSIAGATANAVAENAGKIEIVFGDLRLTRSRDGAINALPDVKISVNGPFTGTRSADGDCDALLAHVDSHLRKAVDTLAVAIEGEVRAWSTSD
jgi:hypothetical protein